MALKGPRTFVGFGFGAIQAGLFLYEAFRSEGFRRLVVAEVVPEVVDALRKSGGDFTVNIAHSDRIEKAEVGPVEIENPASVHDRIRLIESVAQAEEIATAVPSVKMYVSEAPGSIHRILAEGLRRKAAQRGPRAVVYAAENHNHAAELLESAVLGEVPEAERDSVLAEVRFLNTVIGKMSGVLTDPEEIKSEGLATINSGLARAFLVEEFNRILISKIRFRDTSGVIVPFPRGISVFEEKDDLLPFEEAKLHGHNATHALAAYAGAIKGVERIADLSREQGIMAFLRSAFLSESGEALIRKYRNTDSLFTEEGYRAYADDLLARMVNPFLRDSVDRVGRDPERKLGWDDRLVGTIRVAWSQGIRAARYAFGAAAALARMDRKFLRGDVPVAAVLDTLWARSSPENPEREAVLELIEDGRAQLRRWCESGFRDLEGMFASDPV